MRASSPRSPLPYVICVGLVVVYLTGLVLGQLTEVPLLTQLLGGVGGSPPLHRSEPTQLAIPSLGVAATVVTVGVAPDGSIATPADDPTATTGWYADGPTPGELGTAVIVGHVDTPTEPAIFAKLPELRRGRTVEVSRHDHQVARFRIDSVETFPKTAFPAERIFGANDRPRLALVTCGGAWVGGDIGYADNVIVFATLT